MNQAGREAAMAEARDGLDRAPQVVARWARHCTFASLYVFELACGLGISIAGKARRVRRRHLQARPALSLVPYLGVTIDVEAGGPPSRSPSKMAPSR